jgi:hypothetical protein
MQFRDPKLSGANTTSTSELRKNNWTYAWWVRIRMIIQNFVIKFLLGGTNTQMRIPYEKRKFR